MSHLNPSDYPLKRLQIPVKTFEKLWEELQKVLNEEIQGNVDVQQPRSAKFFGMGEFTPQNIPGMKTVASVIASHPDVQALIALEKNPDKINFGAYLYKQQLQVENDPKLQFVTFGKRAYVYGYFMFLGFSDKEAFEERHGLSQRGTERSMTGGVAGSGMPPSFYLGSFFSFRSYTIKHFVVAIDFNYSISENTFPAEEWGFHRLEDVQDNMNSTGHDPSQQYNLSGTALIRNNKLYLNLTTPETEPNWTQMNIMGWGYGAQASQVKSQRIIRCNVQTVSVLGYPIVAEAVLVRIEDHKWKEMDLQPHQVPANQQISRLIAKDELDTLMLYLMMQRRNFWIKNEFLDDLSDLQVRGNLMQNFLYLRGTWRVWNYGLRRDCVVQSKLVIGERYATTFYPYLKPNILKIKPRLEAQVATLSISKGIRPNKLFFHTYLKPNLAVVNSAVFDLDTIDEHHFAEGMFLSGGYDSKGVIGGYCVMKKVESHEADFEPCEFTKEEALAYEAEHQLNGLYEGLRSLWKRKTWPRKKGKYPRADEEPVLEE